MLNSTNNLFSQLANQYLKGEMESNVITDPEIHRYIHGLQKKSEITKIKILNELKQVLPTKSPEFFDQFTPTFINIYKRFVDNEYERRVLESSNQVLALICQYGKKSLQLRFKSFFPQWFILINDYNLEISESAMQAFLIAFPQEKHGSAVQICTDSYLHDLKFYMTLSIATIKQESNLEDEQVEQIYERLKVAAIRSIALAIKWNPMPGFIEQLMEILDFKSKNTVIIELLNTKKTRIVSCILETLNYLLQNQIASQSVLLKSEILLQKTMKFFEEKDRSIQNALWKGFVISLFQKTNPEQIQKLSNLEQMTLAIISKAGYGVGKILYEQWIIFISLNPVYSAAQITKEELYKQKITSYRKLLESILSGLQNEEARFFADSLINSYFEVMYFVLCKRLLPFLNTYPNAFNQLKNVVVQSVKVIVQNTLTQKPNQAYNYNPYNQVPVSLQQFFKLLKIQDDNLQQICTQIFEEFKTLPNEQALIIQNLLAVTPQSMAHQPIQEYLKYVFERIYTQNDLTGVPILEILTPLPQLKQNDAKDKISNNILNIFQQIDLIDSQALFKLCLQIKGFINNIQRIQEVDVIDGILQNIIDAEFKEMIPKEEQQKFKFKWICLFILADSNTDSNYYLLQQEYPQIKKYTIMKPKQCKIANYLIKKTLEIKNLSLKGFIPSILNNEPLHEQRIGEKFKFLAQMAMKDKNYLQAFEEIAFIQDKYKCDVLIFEVILSLYQRQLSQKALFLIKLIDNRYEEQFLEFFQKNQDRGDKFINYLEDILQAVKIDHLKLIQLLNFNLSDASTWRIFAILDCPNDYLKLQYQNNNLDLISTFLAINYSSIMLYDHKLKRYIQNFVSNNVKHFVLDSYEQGEEKAFKLIEFLFQKSEIAYGVALKHLVKQITLEEQELNLAANEKLSKLIISQISDDVGKLITIRQIIHKVDVIKEIPIKQSIQSFLETNKLYHLDLITLGLRQAGSLNELENEEQLEKLIHHLFKQEIVSNYEKMVAFDFINIVTELKTITPFAYYIKEISNLFKNLFQQNVQLQKYYSFSIVAALQFVRKILNFIEAFPVEFLDYLEFELTDSLIQIITFCTNLDQEFMDEQNDTLFIEYAETLLRCLQMEQWHHFDSSIYITLLQSPFIAIQKAAFIALRARTALKEGVDDLLMSIDLKQEELQKIKQNEDEDIEDVITFPLKGKILTHLLAWLVTDKSIQKEKFPLYLNNLAYILQFLNDNGVVARFSHKEIYDCDIDLMIIQDDQSELLKLIVISFYQFIIAQQSYFKQWYNQDCSANQKKLLEDLLMLISKAIYMREVEVIEMKQEQWRCEGFDIYAQKNQQEIIAIYQKEESKIEITIQVPIGYPLKSLKIESNKGVKLGEDKLKKWSLMIRSILSQNNDTILSAIELWKKNIDQQFQGLEECAICYYVIHSSGELPKMACRTCKHKFHSSCIQKWFQSSNKSDCPLCKSQFL